MARGIKNDIKLGMMFGKLRVIECYDGSKSNAPIALCRCNCGNLRKVRFSKLALGNVFSCASCSRKLAWVGRERMSKDTVIINEAFYNYRKSAEKRNYLWNITKEEFEHFFWGECHYCGTNPSKGVDRVVNTDGYDKNNCVSCCMICNRAKNDMPIQNFKDWIIKSYNFQRNKK